MNSNFSETLKNNLFDNIYSLNWSMTVGILSTLINILCSTPLFFAIAWYERFGTNHNRTLLNQLVSSICWVTIVQNLTDLTLGILLNLCGPFSVKFCTFFIWYKSSFYLYTLVLLICITTVKYACIFILQKPVGIHLEIWCLFINIFSIGFSILEQFVFLFLPGRQPTFVFICSGIDPPTGTPGVNFKNKFWHLKCLNWHLTHHFFGV